MFEAINDLFEAINDLFEAINDLSEPVSVIGAHLGHWSPSRSLVPCPGHWCRVRVIGAVSRFDVAVSRFDVAVSSFWSMWPCPRSGRCGRVLDPCMCPCPGSLYVPVSWVPVHARVLGPRTPPWVHQPVHEASSTLQQGRQARPRRGFHESVQSVIYWIPIYRI